MALETSSERCCVALSVAGQLYQDNRVADRSHKELLLPMVQSLCQKAQVELSQLQAIGCGAGPGSFTGVRIGVAAAQALAFAAGCNVVMVNALDVMAYTALSKDPPGLSPGRVLICSRRSRGQAYYLAAYPLASRLRATQAVAQRGAMTLCESGADYEAWLSAQSLDRPGERRLIGDAPPWLSDSATVLAGQELPLVDAHTVMALTVTGLKAGDAVGAEAALPIYLPEDSPWQPR